MARKEYLEVDLRTKIRPRHPRQIESLRFRDVRPKLDGSLFYFKHLPKWADAANAVRDAGQQVGQSVEIQSPRRPVRGLPDQPAHQDIRRAFDLPRTQRAFTALHELGRAVS